MHDVCPAYSIYVLYKYNTYKYCADAVNGAAVYDVCTQVGQNIRNTSQSQTALTDTLILMGELDCLDRVVVLYLRLYVCTVYVMYCIHDCTVCV